MRRSWDPLDYVGAPLIPSPAANRTRSVLESEARNGSYRKPFKGYGKLMRKKPTPNARSVGRNVNEARSSPLSSVEEAVLQLSLDSDEENVPPSPLNSSVRHRREQQCENAVAVPGRDSDIEITFESHPVQKRTRALRENRSPSSENTFRSCLEPLAPLESTRLSRVGCTVISSRPFSASNASSLSAIVAPEVEAPAPLDASISSDSTLNQSQPDAVARYCEIFPIAEGLSPRYSPAKSPLWSKVGVRRKSNCCRIPHRKSVIAETESGTSSSESPSGSPRQNASARTAGKPRNRAASIVGTESATSSSEPVPGSPISGQNALARTAEKLRNRTTNRGRQKYRKSIIIPESSDSDSEEEPPLTPRKLFQSPESNEEQCEMPRTSPRKRSRSPELVLLEDSDSVEEPIGRSVQNVVKDVPAEQNSRDLKIIERDAGGNRVNRWVLENTRNFRRNSSSSTLATFREFVEKEDDSRDVDIESRISEEVPPAKKKSCRRRSMQCGERDESDVERIHDSSSDEEEADRRLRQLFEETRKELAETERKNRTVRRSRSLDNFIVPDDDRGSSVSESAESDSGAYEATPLRPPSKEPPFEEPWVDELWRKPVGRPTKPTSGPAFERYRTPAPKPRTQHAATAAKPSASKSVRGTCMSKANMKKEVESANMDGARDAKMFLGALTEGADSWGAPPLVLADLCKMNFSVVREELTRLLYKIFNLHCFESKLPADMEIKWNVRMVKTAGFCVYKMQRFRPDADGYCRPPNRFARIELSVKVLDSADRLRDTLAHEMCHAMSWIVSECSGGHGPIWKRWTKRVAWVFPNMPRITTLHTYEIKTKYTYCCQGCGYRVGRHSKSLDVERKRCGHCYGRFELIVNGKPTAPSDVMSSSTARTGKTSSSSTTPASRPLNKFAEFVQKNFKTVKEREGAGKSHAEIMGTLSARFAALKLISGTNTK